MLRRKLEKSEQSCSELRQNTEKLESKVELRRSSAAPQLSGIASSDLAG